MCEISHCLWFQLRRLQFIHGCRPRRVSGRARTEWLTPWKQYQDVSGHGYRRCRCMTDGALPTEHDFCLVQRNFRELVSNTALYWLTVRSAARTVRKWRKRLMQYVNAAKEQRAWYDMLRNEDILSAISYRTWIFLLGLISSNPKRLLQPRDNTKNFLRFRKQRQSQALLHIVCVYKRNLFIVSYVLYSFMSLKKIKRATVIKMLVFGKKYFLSMDSTNILTEDTYWTDNHKYLLQKVTKIFPFSLINT